MSGPSSVPSRSDTTALIILAPSPLTSCSYCAPSLARATKAWLGCGIGHSPPGSPSLPSSEDPGSAAAEPAEGGCKAEGITAAVESCGRDGNADEDQDEDEDDSETRGGCRAGRTARIRNRRLPRLNLKSTPESTPTFKLEFVLELGGNIRQPPSLLLQPWEIVNVRDVDVPHKPPITLAASRLSVTAARTA